MLLQRPKVQTWTGLKGCDGILRELCRNLKEQHIEEWTKSSSQQHQAFIGLHSKTNNYKATHQHTYSLNIGTFLSFELLPINMLLAITGGQRKIQHWCSIQQSESSFSSGFGLHHLEYVFPPLQLNSRALNAVFSFFNWEVTVWHHKTFTNQTFYAQKPQNHLIQYWHKTLLNWFSKNIFYSFIVLLFFYCNDASLQYILSQLKAGLFPVC